MLVHEPFDFSYLPSEGNRQIDKIEPFIDDSLLMDDGTYDFSTRFIDKYGCGLLPDGWVRARLYFPMEFHNTPVLAMIKNEKCIVFFKEKRTFKT